MFEIQLAATQYLSFGLYIQFFCLLDKVSLFFFVSAAFISGPSPKKLDGVILKLDFEKAYDKVILSSPLVSY
jgi:hypothetical protein